MPRFRFAEVFTATATQIPPAKDDLVPLGPSVIDSSVSRSLKFTVEFDKAFDPEAYVPPSKVHVAVYPPGTVIDATDPFKVLNEAPANGASEFPAEAGPFDTNIFVGVGVNTTALFKREPSLEVPYAIILEYAE